VRLAVVGREEAREPLPQALPDPSSSLSPSSVSCPPDWYPSHGELNPLIHLQVEITSIEEVYQGCSEY